MLPRYLKRTDLVRNASSEKLRLSLFSFFSVLGSFQGNQWNRPRMVSTLDKYADDRKNANDVLNDSEYIVGNSRSVTKKDWDYKHSPRSGSLFIRTASGKVLYPGELNTVRNAVKFQDFIDDFLIKLPNAKPNTKYTLVAYSEGYLAKALANVKGEDLFAGIQGENLGDVFQGVNKDELGNTVVKDTKYCIEILEQNPNEQLSTVGDTKSDWHDPKNRLGKELNGTAGKTCFVVLPKGMEELENDFYSEFELIIATFESHMKQGPAVRSAVGTSGDAASKIATSFLDDAVNRQTMFVASPRRNSLYSNDYQNYGSERPQNYESEQYQNYRSQNPQNYNQRSSQQPKNFGYNSPQQQKNFQRSYSAPNLGSSYHGQ